MSAVLSFMAAMALLPYAIAGILFFLVLLLLLVLLINSGYRKFKEWKATGFCRHEFELNRTNSYGQHHWYRCKHCSTERLK